MESSDDAALDVLVHKTPDPMDVEEASPRGNTESTDVGADIDGTKIQELARQHGIAMKSFQPADDGPGDSGQLPPVE